jgi:acyl transferase domain-containing protein
MKTEATQWTDGIAIIGMAGKFPGAPDLATFWKNLRAGVESVTRFTAEEIEGPWARRDDPQYVRARAILPDVDLFDADFFGIQPREAEYTDPQHRLLLETAWETLESAGCDPGRFDGAIGVFAGCSLNTYLLHNLASDPAFLAEFLASQQMGAHPAMLGNDKDFLATRLAYKLNLRGPGVTVQSACSTSLVAVCQACQSLLSFQCDLALAGGVSITFPQKRGYLYEEGSIVSRDGRCRPFDAAADGTVFGDGVGLVALKRADDALRDGDPIRAIIRGFAVNNDGAGKVSFMAPSVEGQAQVIAAAHALAGIEVGTIRYIEAHGTGTFLGDPIEVAALAKAFGEVDSARQFCALSALKGNVGHLEVAAGVAGLIKAVLALEHAEIPPTLNFSAPNPQIDFAATPFYVARELQPWPVTDAPRRAGVSSFGVGGTNAHVVLEQAPSLPTEKEEAAPRLVLLSARTPAALEKMTERLSDRLAGLQEAGFPAAAATLQLGRRSFRHRRSLVASTAKEAVQLLAKEKSKAAASVSGEKKTVVFLFPGQGAQQAAMGRELYAHERVFRVASDRCCEILSRAMKLDFRAALFEHEGSDSAGQLRQTQVTQPALFVIEYALAQTWMALGIRPGLMVGHSLGEYVAAVLAGVFTLEDALHLLVVRGRLMQSLPAGSMLAVALPESDVRPLLPASLSLAAANSPRSSVVSGPIEAVEDFRKMLEQKGIAARPLETSHAFHSAALDPILEQFAAEVRGVQLRPPQIPIISSLLGRVATAEWTEPSYWVRQMREPVRFGPALDGVFAQENRVLLEVGPGQTLTSFARQHPLRSEAYPVIPSSGRMAGEGDREALLAATGRLWEAGVEIDWRALHGKKNPRRIELPTYPFERKSFWIAPTNSSSTKPSTASPAPISVSSAKPASVPADASRVEALVNEQLRIMAKQIEVLRQSKPALAGRGGKA